MTSRYLESISFVYISLISFKIKVILGWILSGKRMSPNEKYSHAYHVL